MGLDLRVEIVAYGLRSWGSDFFIMCHSVLDGENLQKANMPVKLKKYKGYFRHNQLRFSVVYLSKLPDFVSLNGLKVK